MLIATTHTSKHPEVQLMKCFAQAQHDEGRDQASELRHCTGRVVHSLKTRERDGEAENM